MVVMPTGLESDQSFRLAARQAAVTWKASTTTLTEEARLPGRYKTWPPLPFCLPPEYSSSNLLPEARALGLDRFTAAGIPWHDGVGDGPSNHLLDSQVNCVNALMPFVNEPIALRDLLSPVLPVREVIPFGAAPVGDAVVSEWDRVDHVVFEWQGLSNHLGEWAGRPTRGSRATSADAAIRYVAADGTIELALIEWKFTESYPDGTLHSSPTSLATRRKRYQALFGDSAGPIDNGLIGLDDLFAEPVYQLARLALLASSIERARELGAYRVRVLYIAPAANLALWNSPGSTAFAAHAARYGGRVDRAWPPLLRQPDRFAILDGAMLAQPNSPTSVEYKARYGFIVRD